MRSLVGRGFVFSLLMFGGLAESFARSSNSSSGKDFYQISLEELGQVEITIATGNSTPLDKAPSTASVISADEIEAMGARTLDEVLEYVPGLHVSVSTISRLDSIYSIRGIHTGFNPQVLLLINGVPLQDELQSGRPTLFKLPANTIQRVEVIRGPGSAVYGADAYSGVINVITKDASSIENSNFGIRTGSFGVKDAWFEGATKWNEWDVSLSLSHIESDGDDSRVLQADLQTGLDAAFMTDASLAPGALATNYSIFDARLGVSNNDWKINLWHWYSDDAGVGAGAAQALDYVGSDTGDLYLADVNYKFDDAYENWQFNIRASYLHYDHQVRYNILPAGTVLPIGSDGNIDFVSPAGIVQFPDGYIGNPSGVTKDQQFDFVSIYTGLESHRFRFAIGARHLDLDTGETKNFGTGVIDGITPVVDGTLTDVNDTPFVYLADSSRTIRYLSLQDEWRIFSDWDLAAGVRYDDYSDLGSTINPRLGLVWAVNENVTSKLLYGSAFRAPSFSEQGFRNNPVSIGNPDLDPEEIDTLELSLLFRINEKFQHTLSIFSYQATDMIEFVPDEDATTSTAQNIRDQDGKGFEWELFWKPMHSLKVDANYSWQDAKDANSDIEIHDAPGQQFSIKAYWAFYTHWNLNTRMNWVADRKRAEGDTRPEIDDFTQIDITLTRNDVIPNLDVTIAGRNLTDERVEEPSALGALTQDYPMESRSAWVSIEYSF